MTAYADEFTAIAQRTQDATSTAVRSWTESMKSYTEHITAENPLPQPGDVHAILDTWYDLASKLVAEQRRFVKTVVDAGTEAAGAVTEQARAAASAVPVAPFTVPTYPPPPRRPRPPPPRRRPRRRSGPAPRPPDRGDGHDGRHPDPARSSGRGRRRSCPTVSR